MRVIDMSPVSTYAHSAPASTVVPAPSAAAAAAAADTKVPETVVAVALPSGASAGQSVGKCVQLQT